MIFSVMIRKGRWKAVGGFVVATGFAVAHSPAFAHLAGDWTASDACSPHDATGSKGGTVFSNCLHWETGPNRGGDYTDRWRRDITCAAGTACANALCGSGKAVTGGYTTQVCVLGGLCQTSSTYKHGIPSVSSLVCE